jgi:L-asparaginase II
VSAPLIVEVTRSGFVESTHLVDVAVVDRTGALVASAGDPDRSCAFRSSAKPIQARVALESGWVPDGGAHLAIACASHNGEPAHVDAVRAVLAAAGVAEDDLRCPEDFPAFVAAIPKAGERTRVFHNCSGKHASMLAACAAAGWPLDDYRAPEHPLQLAILKRIDELSGGHTAVLVDGCGVVTPVAPLQSFARAFGAIDDGGPETAAMRAHPFLVGGTDRIDTDLMTAAPHLVVKSGAEGLACVSAEDFSIAVKSRDGTQRARTAAVVFALQQLRLIDDELASRLADHRELLVLGGGLPVGRAAAAGALQPYR